MNPLSAETLRLKDGSVLQGERVRIEDGVLVFKVANLGEMKIPLSSIAEDRAPVQTAEYPASEEEPRHRDRDPSGQALFFLPTAFTPDKNSFTFRDFELFFLAFGFSPTNSTSLSAGFLFPITTEFQLVTAGLKQRIWQAPGGHSAVAMTGNVTKPIGGDNSIVLYNSNLMVSGRFPGERFQDAFGIHGGLGYYGISGDGESGSNFSFGGGFEARLTPSSKFIVEYLNASPFDPTSSNIGLLTLGFRLHGKNLAADIAGFRFVGTDGDWGSSIFLLPLLVVSYRI